MNPILALNEYIPDVEAHVFDGRVYLYGSHDKANSKRFCVQDYVFYSSKVDDLKNWTNNGISYLKTEDPHSINSESVDYYAPDCVKGNDGKYYLYYVAMGPNTIGFGPISVAISDKPDGPFKYYGDLKYPDGSIVRDFLTNDPAVINDNGHIYLYYGWGLGRDFRNKLLKPLYDFALSKIGRRTLKEIKEANPSVLSCCVSELEDDMLTIKYKPKAILDSKTTADKNSKLYHHPFYEAASIRKIKDLYYLVYSSGENNELAYATSKYPDHDFRYRGVIISNSDLGYKGNKKPKNNSSTIHGSIECINDKYYVFYHRSTNNTDYSRQVCMEEIEISDDGYIEQVEMTSSGIDKVLRAKGIYSAGICCNLISEKPIKLGIGKQQEMPRITEIDNKLIVKDLNSGCIVIYKYFDLSNTDKLILNYQGEAKIKINNILLKNKEVILNKDKKSEIKIEIIEGKCDIESLEFI